MVIFNDLEREIEESKISKVKKENMIRPKMLSGIVHLVHMTSLNKCC